MGRFFCLIDINRFEPRVFGFKYPTIIWPVDNLPSHRLYGVLLKVDESFNASSQFPSDITRVYILEGLLWETCRRSHELQSVYLQVFFKDYFDKPFAIFYIGFIL